MLSLMKGKGIDIGCGPDPVSPGVDRFDRQDGDANRISVHVKTQYDYVFASHVLEHMDEPVAALREWLKILKPGGHMIILVPDEDLYEQGVFPSVFNDDHKHTFTIAKARSWSPRSVNVLDLPAAVGADLVSVVLQDQGYDRRLLRHSPSRAQLRLLTAWRRLARTAWLRPLRPVLERLFLALGAPVDQTALPDARLAQIQFILRKPLS